MAQVQQGQGASSGGGMFTQFLTMPFSTQMNAFSWILFLGFILVVAFAWTRVLSHIVE